MRKSILSFLAVLIITISIIPFGKCIADDSLSIGGKGMYLWQIWNANGGGKNLNTIVTKLKSLGVSWLVIKMGDGNSNYNTSGHSLYSWASANYGNMDSVVSVFHANGIKLFAFQYVYGEPRHWSYTASETDVANSILSVKGIDGLIIDAEIQYDTSETRVAAAQAYCDSIHAHHPDAFLGLTAWARVEGHNTFPWTTFLDRVDVNMPQTYWAARPTTVQNELSLMSSQFKYWISTWVAFGDSGAAKPIMPLGQGEYFGYSNDVQQGEITNFCNLSQNTYHYPGVSLWEYNQITHSYVWNEYAAAWQITSIKDANNGPSSFKLSQNYPNPFNPTTVISYSIPKTSFVTIKVYDILGREVAVLVNKNRHAGNYNVEFAANKISSGVYFYTMHAGDFVETRKLIVLK